MMVGRVLLIEPDSQAALRCSAALTEAQFAVDHVIDASSAYQQLSTTGYHAVITDYQLPDGTAIDMLKYITEHLPETVTIVVSQVVDETLLLAAMAAGASYCIPKVDDYGAQLPKLIKLSQQQQQSFKTQSSDTVNRFTPSQPTTEYKGQLAVTTVPRLLRTFYQQQANGVLHIAHDGDSISLYFRDGTMGFAVNALFEYRLGEMLVEKGRITQDDFAHASEMMNGENIRFGTALTELDIIRPDELKPLIVQFTLKMIYRSFSWETGEFIFEHGARLENEVMLSLSTADVIFAGIRHLKDRELIDRWLGDCDRVLIPTSDPLSLFQALTLRQEEIAVMEKIDYPMSVNQVRNIAGLDEDVVSRTLCGLIETGMMIPFETKAEKLVVEMPKFSEICDVAPLPPNFDARAAAEFCYEVELTLQKFRSSNHYAVLGVVLEGSPADVTNAYRQLARKFHPDRHSQLSSYNLNLKADLKAIFERLAEAYYTLSDPQRRAAYDRTLKPVQPARATQPLGELRPVPMKQGTMPLPTYIPGLPGSDEYEQALTHYSKREFDKARLALLKAIDEDPDNAEYRVALARSMLKIPIYIRQAEAAYLKAIELAPNNADYYAELGLLYQQFSQTSQARNMMQQALEIDPTNPIALRVKM